MFIGEASWDRGSRLLSVGEGPQQIRLKGGRNRDLMKKALQVPKRKQESWKLSPGGLVVWMFEFVCLSEKKVMLWLDDSEMCCLCLSDLNAAPPPLLSLML